MLRTLEKIYAVLAMLFLANAVVQRTVVAEESRLAPHPLDAIGRLLVCALLVPLVVMHWREVLHGLRQSGWIVALCGLALASSLWSGDSGFTLRHGIFLSCITLFAVYLATCFDWDEQLNLFGWMAVIVVAGSAFMAVFFPAYGLSQEQYWGSVKGLFPQKNIMGGQMVFAILTMGLARPKGIPAWVRTATLIGACALLILSNSATPLVALLFCVAMYPLLHMRRSERRRTLPLWVPLAPVFLMAAGLAIANFDVFVEAAGRNSALTGRIPMWKEVLSAIGTHPWLGFGYDTFWSAWSTDLGRVKYVLQGYLPPHAHNGYLDLLLSMGFVGLAVFLCSYVVNLMRAGRVFRLPDTDLHGAKWPLLVLLFFTAVNLAESDILHPMTFFWIPYVTIYVSLGLMAEERAWAPAQAASEVADGDETAEVSGAVPGYPA